jgi:DNA mismatch repair protein MutS
LVLAELEAEDRSSPARRLLDDLPLFAAAPRPSAAPAREPLLDQILALLAALHPDDMSPREALEALYALKQKAAGLKRD